MKLYFKTISYILLHEKKCKLLLQLNNDYNYHCRLVITYLRWQLTATLCIKYIFWIFINDMQHNTIAYHWQHISLYMGEEAMDNLLWKARSPMLHCAKSGQQIIGYRPEKVLLSSSLYVCQALLLVVVPYSALTTTYYTKNPEVEWRRPLASTRPLNILSTKLHHSRKYDHTSEDV